MWDFRNPFFFIILELLRRVQKTLTPVASTPYLCGYSFPFFHIKDIWQKHLKRRILKY